MLQLNQQALIIPLVIVLVIYLIRLNRKSTSSRPDSKSFILDILFISYCFLVIGMLYFPLVINYNDEIPQTMSINFIPFWPMIRSMIISPAKDILYMAAYTSANALLFVALSGYLVIVILASFSAEIVQFLLIKACRYYDRIIDIDDLLLNGIGGILSFLWFNKMSKKKAKPSEMADIKL